MYLHSLLTLFYILCLLALAESFKFSFPELPVLGSSPSVDVGGTVGVSWSSESDDPIAAKIVLYNNDDNSSIVLASVNTTDITTGFLPVRIPSNSHYTVIAVPQNSSTDNEEVATTSVLGSSPVITPIKNANMSTQVSTMSSSSTMSLTHTTLSATQTASGNTGTLHSTYFMSDFQNLRGSMSMPSPTTNVASACADDACPPTQTSTDQIPAEDTIQLQSEIASSVSPSVSTDVDKPEFGSKFHPSHTRTQVPHSIIPSSVNGDGGSTGASNSSDNDKRLQTPVIIGILLGVAVPLLLLGIFLGRRFTRKLPSFCYSILGASENHDDHEAIKEKEVRVDEGEGRSKERDRGTPRAYSGPLWKRISPFELLKGNPKGNEKSGWLWDRENGVEHEEESQAGLSQRMTSSASLIGRTWSDSQLALKETRAVGLQKDGGRSSRFEAIEDDDDEVRSMIVASSGVALDPFQDPPTRREMQLGRGSTADNFSQDYKHPSRIRPHSLTINTNVPRSNLESNVIVDTNIVSSPMLSSLMRSSPPSSTDVSSRRIYESNRIHHLSGSTLSSGHEASSNIPRYLSNRGSPLSGQSPILQSPTMSNNTPTTIHEESFWSPSAESVNSTIRMEIQQLRDQLRRLVDRNESGWGLPLYEEQPPVYSA